MIFNIGDEFIYRAFNGKIYKYIINRIDSRYLFLSMYYLNDTSFGHDTFHEIQTFINNINSGAIEIIYNINNLNLDFTIRHEEIL